MSGADFPFPNWPKGTTGYAAAVIEQEGDPGATGPGSLWLVPSTGALSVRNPANTAWVAVTGAGSTPNLAAVLTAGNAAGTKKITGLVDPTAASQEAATAHYVDAGDTATLTAAEAYTDAHVSSPALVGNTTPGATPGAFASDSASGYAVKVVLAAQKTLVAIGAYIDMHSLAGLAAGVAVYADNAGAPGAVLAVGWLGGTSGGGLLVGATDTPQWLDIPCAAILPAATYWLVFFGVFQAGSWRIYHGTGTNGGILTLTVAGYIGSDQTFAADTVKYNVRGTVL